MRTKESRSACKTLERKSSSKSIVPQQKKKFFHHSQESVHYNQAVMQKGINARGEIFLARKKFTYSLLLDRTTYVWEKEIPCSLRRRYINENQNAAELAKTSAASALEWVYAAQSVVMHQTSLY